MAARRRVPSALQRRRRVLFALVLLNGVELAGVALVGPGFWIGFAVSFAILLADLAYLRHRAVVARRQRHARQRRRAWVAAEQAAVRREHARRAAAKAATRSAEPVPWQMTPPGGSPGTHGEQPHHGIDEPRRYTPRSS